jgi:hypothetical protein
VTHLAIIPEFTVLPFSDLKTKPDLVPQLLKLSSLVLTRSSFLLIFTKLAPTCIVDFLFLICSSGFGIVVIVGGFFLIFIVIIVGSRRRTLVGWFSYRGAV